MTQALATMRVDYDQCQIKSLQDSNNPMLAKRRSLATKQWTTTNAVWRNLCKSSLCPFCI